MEATFNKIDDTARRTYTSLGAVCLRGLFGDWIDVLRAGRNSPPFPGYNMQNGQRLRTDRFPVLWPVAGSK